MSRWCVEIYSYIWYILGLTFVVDVGKNRDGDVKWMAAHIANGKTWVYHHDTQLNEETWAKVYGNSALP